MLSYTEIREWLELGGGGICDSKRGAGLLLTDPTWVHSHCCEKSKQKSLTAVADSERETRKCLLERNCLVVRSVLSGGIGISLPVVCFRHAGEVSVF